MGDDIDDLLNEVESKFCSKSGDKKTTKNNTALENNKLKHTSKSTQNKRNDDLDDLLNEILDDDDIKHVRKPIAATGSVHQKISKSEASQPSQKTKCFPVYIGGSSCPQGLGTTVNRRCCDRLRCTDCDFLVSAFDSVQWHSSTDYLFLRNNMPDYHKLKSKLTSKKGSRAYACQCKSRSVRDFVDLQKESDLKWVCAKH